MNRDRATHRHLPTLRTEKWNCRYSRCQRRLKFKCKRNEYVTIGPVNGGCVELALPRCHLQGNVMVGELSPDNSRQMSVLLLSNVYSKYTNQKQLLSD